MDKKKYLNIAIIFICIISITLIGTYALKLWTSTNNTELTFRIGEYTTEGMNCKNGEDITISNIGPVFDYEKDGEIVNFRVISSSINTEPLNVSFNVSTITDNLKEKSFKYILLSSIDNNTFTEETKGNFSNVNNGTSLKLIDGKIITKTTYYKLIIYIDGNMENPISMQNGSITGNVEMCVESIIDANSPDLVQGLIPVVYDENTSNWKKADSENTSNSWYDYSNKLWANAVLVSGKKPKEKITSSVTVNLISASYASTSSTSSASISGSESVYSNYTLDTTTGKYKLSGESYTIDDENASVLIGYYYCYSGSSVLECTKVLKLENYIGKVSLQGIRYRYSGTLYTAELSNTINKYVSQSYTLNNDGTFTLSSPSKQGYSSNLVDYYTCDSSSSYTCSTMYKIKTASTNSVSNVDKYTTTFESVATNKYDNVNAGTVIAEDDISAFYVWIPRYKYKVWNINKVIGTDSYDAYNTGIDIKFENEKNSTGTISCTYSYESSSSSAGSPNESCAGSNGDYYTHPAFTFGSDELRGFWIGKFELTGSSSKLTILPNASSLRSQSVSSFSTMIQNMQASNNIYGLNTSRTNTDSHMLTNYEWGAVAYLTNSKYGRCTDGSCTEVTINNCLSTGKAGDTISATSASSACANSENKYNGVKGMLASTTGNITGIYDMSGGAKEYTMGNTSSTSGSYTFYPRSSGFESNWYTTGTFKYITTYAYSLSHDGQQAYNKGRLGDATGETVLTDDVNRNGGWYGDRSYFDTWLVRGGGYQNASDAGVFFFDGDDGSADGNFNNGDYSSRAALVSLK